MGKLAIVSLVFIGAFLAGAQGQKTMPKHNLAESSKPECIANAICFSGEVREDEQFRKEISADLEFVFRLPGEFEVEIKHAEPSCKNLFWVANPPFRAHHDTEIDAAYDWTAEQEVKTSPREFRFATNCAAYQTLANLLQTDSNKFIANFDSLANGEGRLWITDSRVTHSHGNISNEQGAIEWIKFSVEIKLRKRN